MKNLNDLDRYRLRGQAVLDVFGGEDDETCGVFVVPSPIDKQDLRVIASTGCDWDHVSVSRRTRCPNWQEMEYVKRLFFRHDEIAMQSYRLDSWRCGREEKTL